jgi:hypothetical protein
MVCDTDKKKKKEKKKKKRKNEKEKKKEKKRKSMLSWRVCHQSYLLLKSGHCSLQKEKKQHQVSQEDLCFGVEESVCLGVACCGRSIHFQSHAGQFLAMERRHAPGRSVVTSGQYVASSARQGQTQSAAESLLVERAADYGRDVGRAKGRKVAGGLRAAQAGKDQVGLGPPRA